MSECDPLCTEGLYRGDQVKMVLTQYGWCPRKKRSGCNAHGGTTVGKQREGAAISEPSRGAWARTHPRCGPRRQPPANTPTLAFWPAERVSAPLCGALLLSTRKLVQRRRSTDVKMDCKPTSCGQHEARTQTDRRTDPAEQNAQTRDRRARAASGSPGASEGTLASTLVTQVKPRKRFP